MPPPLDPVKRSAIVDDIKADELGCRAIARKHDVSPSTVSLIAQQDGIEAFGRAQTKRATEARQVDMAAWRAAFAERMARRAEWFEERIDELQPVVVVTKEGADVEYVEASARDARDFMTAIGIAVDKIGVLTRDDSQGLAAVDSWLRSLGVGATQP